MYHPVRSTLPGILNDYGTTWMPFGSADIDALFRRTHDTGANWLGLDGFLRAYGYPLALSDLTSGPGRLTGT